MKTPYVCTRTPLSRRQALRGLGATFIGLPMLEIMTPTFGKTALASSNHAGEPPKRFVAACATLGFHAPFLFPETPGFDYEFTPYLERLRRHRDDITVISGLSHPDQQGNNGHASEMTWLTSARRPGLAGFRNSISIDQVIADQVGHETRFPSLVLSTSGRSMSWTSTGIEIPGETSPQKLFTSLFMTGSPDQVKQEMQQLRRGRSILDTVMESSKRLDRELGHNDRRKLEEYLAAVRDLEQRLQQAEGWSEKPKPEVNASAPKDITEKNDAIGKQKLMYDMIVLALQTDSTRTITFQLSGMNAVPTIPGVSNDWHNLSHHGKDPEKIDELRVIEDAEFEAFGDFLTKLKATKENDVSLLESTAVLFGSNLGNASSHDWRNLPVIVAGGGYSHGAYVSHDASNNTPLANLFVSFAQRMGVETDTFGSSTAAGIHGLDVA